jgi:predicted CXXCH cytochrome family protein
MEASPTAPCATCHDEPSSWAKKKTVHAPVVMEECLACHNPHASGHGGLLRRGPARTCFTCHEDLAVRIRSETAHDAALTDRECLSCHDPHASDRSSLLIDEESELCAVCHEEIVRGADVAHPHAPVAGGDCLSCHDPHSSPRPYLTKEAEPAVCTACHSTGDRAVVTAHNGISISEARCTTCHSPHGSESAKLLRSEVHPPFGDGTCEICHEDPAKPAAALRAGSEELCTACHEPRLKGHVVPEEAQCISCHTPHAASTSAFIAGREKVVCLDCHETVAAQHASAESVHPPFQGKQDCTLCHELHTGHTRDLLKKTQAYAVCSTCHSTHAEFSHPMGPGVPDESRPGHFIDCLSCHDPHGTGFSQFLLADQRRDLCVRCHAQDGRPMRRRPPG